MHILTLDGQKRDNTSIKKRLNKIDGRGRDGSTKRYTDKGSMLGIIRYVLHPYCFSLKYHYLKSNIRLNHDGGYELPGCWIATMKKLGGGAKCAGANHVDTSASTSAQGHTGTQAQHPHL